MQKIEFIKMHGLGNDFVIIDRRKHNVNINKVMIHKLSDRKTGAGCDQVITIDKNVSSEYDANIQIFNPNGDRAEACGNGTRCVAKLLFEEKKTNNLKLRSLAGILNAQKINNDIISVNLGKLSSAGPIIIASLFWIFTWSDPLASCTSTSLLVISFNMLA